MEIDSVPAIEQIVEQGHLNTILTCGVIHAEVAMGRLTVTPNASPDIRSYAQTSCRKQDNPRSAADRVSRIKRFVVDHNEVVTDSELKTSIRVSGAKRSFKIMDLRVAQ
jgi:hypothetical protein